MFHLILELLKSTMWEERLGMPPTTKKRSAFVAMAMDRDNPRQGDVLDTVKQAARACQIKATRIDDEVYERSISAQTLDLIRAADYVIVDLTHERPNVYYEAGCAIALGKPVVYIAESTAPLHFNVRDYPVVRYSCMRELKKGVRDRLRALAGREMHKG